jgi:alkanesulfonate monooxygenase SsuD/methylene tetrahydromethanopterin reductase-like flavin-dependent oxidoreductase (luciferase family)
LFGIGGGWNAEEMADHGTTFETRFKLMCERIAAMKEIWTKSEPEYHGELVDFPSMKTWPKSVQTPHPPVIVGGAFPYAARRALAYGDGWIPHASRPQYGDVTEFLQRFREMAAEAGRDPTSVPVTVWGGPGGSGPAEAPPRSRHRPGGGEPALGPDGGGYANPRPLGRADTAGLAR